MNKSLINSIEALLFGAGRPLTLSEIRNILNNNGGTIELSDIKKSLNMLEERYINTSIEIQEVASGYRLNIKQEHSSSLGNIWNDKTPRISKALMETISIIAFKQPVTRGDIEDIRGVSVSTRSIRSLLERNWIRVSGTRDVPGRPALYSTTKDFLDDLNLKSISDLPELPEITDDSKDDFLSQVV
ncbi:MAG: SMC-Scp complex subunit ScpB [SAR86 cluster bacterium]|uniref:SMC-Scp complex subunit ScpB n=1 Tax=SAR86 cluster bacterium TaxID=2030880 RepID=A0A520N2K3_9GAMM|nr:MAG: SMC-Scp complex subunit ScpB [SAR86 cluster bacterium]